MRLWIKNSSGEQDATLTMAFIGFVIVLAKVLLSGVVVTLAGSTVSFGSIDAAVVAAVLTPTLGAYVARKHSDNVATSKEV